MSNWKRIVALGLVFGFVGLAGYPQRADAIVPNPCDQYTCKNVAYW